MSHQPESVEFEFRLAKLHRSGDHEFSALRSLAEEMLECIHGLEEKVLQLEIDNEHE